VPSARGGKAPANATVSEVTGHASDVRNGSTPPRARGRAGARTLAATPNGTKSTTAANDAAEGGLMAKPADTGTTSATSTAARVPVSTRTSSKTATKVAPRAERSPAETEKIRVALHERLAELREEYDLTLSEISELQRDRLTDSAGDDQADTGTKTFEREQEISLANGILERVTQVERALERLDEGGYGWCERCGNPIPVERLAAFPSATLCVTCKQLEERR